MRLMPTWLTVICAVCFFGACSFAQELKEMQLSEVPAAEQKPVIVVDASEAILVVYSTIPDLSFESNLGIIEVANPAPGVYYLHLNPGTNLVTFKGDGYLALQERFYIARKEAKQVKISSRSEQIGFGSIYISTDPPGAQITMNGKIMGTSPLDMKELVAGKYLIGIFLKDMARVDTIVHIAKEKVTILDVNLSQFKRQYMQEEEERLVAERIWTLWKPRTYRDLNTYKIGFNPYCTISGLVYDLFGVLSIPLVVSKSPFYRKVGLIKLALTTTGIVAMALTPFYDDEELNKLSAEERGKYDRATNLSANIFGISWLSDIIVSLGADFWAQSHDNNNLYRIYDLRRKTQLFGIGRTAPEKTGLASVRVFPYYVFSVRRAGVRLSLEW